MVLAYHLAHAKQLKIVSKSLNFMQKQRRMDIAQEMLTTFNEDPDLLKKIVTGNGSREPRPKKVTMCSFKCKGFAHCVLRL